MKYCDKKLLLFTSLLFIYGLLMVFSSSSVSSFMRYGVEPTNFFIRQALFLFLGAAIFVIGSIIPTKHYTFWAWFGLVVVSFCLVAVLIYGVVTNGSKSWIDIPIIGRFQPSELAKLLFIPLMGTYYGSKKMNNDSIIRSLIPVAIGIILTGLVILQKDMGTAIIFSFLVAFMFFTSNVNSKLKRAIAIFALFVIGLFSILLFTNGNDILSQEQNERLHYFNPCSKFLDSGNQVCNGYIAINNSNGIGMGLGNSTQKYLYLPESHTDFIYAILVEELGLIGVALLFGLYIFAIARIIIIGRNTNKDANAMICYGVAFYIFFHIIINLGGVTGLIPLTGITLPFISYGGTFTLSLIVCLTMVQRIKIENTLSEKSLKKIDK